MEQEYVTAKEFRSFKETCSVKHKQVQDLEQWISKLDGRMWFFIMGLLFNSIVGLATLLMLLIKAKT